MILWTLSITDFENFFHLCAEILHVTLFWIFFLDIKFVFVLIVLTIVWFTHMIRYLKLSMDFEFILLHIWMAFSDVLDLAEAAFCQKITKYNSQMWYVYSSQRENLYLSISVHGKVFSHIKENHITLRSRVLRNICTCMYAFVRSTDRYYLKISFCLL